MSAAANRQLLREFIVCATLSFIIILGVIHLLLHLLQMYFSSGLALRSPLTKFLAAPAVHLAQIAQVHVYLVVVFKVTVACTVLVLATREAFLWAGLRMGWWRGDEDAAADAKITELEAGELWVPYSDVEGDLVGEKMSFTSAPSSPPPAPAQELLIQL